MRTLYACLRIMLHDRAGANYWIRFWGLSFWLILGLNSLGSAAAATTLNPQSETSQSAIAAIATPASRVATQKSRSKAYELSIQQHSATEIGREGDDPVEASFASDRFQPMALPEASVAKSLPSKPPNSAAELGLATTLGLGGNRLYSSTLGADELLLVGLEESVIAIDKTFISNASESAVSEAVLPSIEPVEANAIRVLSQVTESTESPEEGIVSQSAASLEPIENYRPLLEFQAVSIYQDGDFSGRLRATGIYALNEQVLFGAVVDLTTGNAFVDSEAEGLSLNELYISAAPIWDMPNFRLVGGLVDFTSYFDRNSFAKDAATHFFNPVFQTNPALSAAGITSRPGLLVNWSATDNLELKAAAFSSTRDLGDFAIDGFAAEVGLRVENFILRGTYATARDAGEDDGFAEIFQFQRDDGGFGLSDDDREVAYGLNAEYFFESINLGIFGRYGWYENQDLDEDGTTFSLGMTALDVFLDGDRLGLAYGQRLSNSDLRSGKTPDVWELLYDAPIFDGVRAGISLQSQDEFSDTFLGLRLRADW